MAIGCVSEYTQELKEQLDEAQKGYKSKYFEETWGELFREVMPKIKEEWERFKEEEIKSKELLEQQAKENKHLDIKINKEDYPKAVSAIPIRNFDSSEKITDQEIKEIINNDPLMQIYQKFFPGRLTGVEYSGKRELGYKITKNGPKITKALGATRIDPMTGKKRVVINEHRSWDAIKTGLISKEKLDHLSPQEKNSLIKSMIIGTLAHETRAHIYSEDMFGKEAKDELEQLFKEAIEKDKQDNKVFTTEYAKTNQWEYLAEGASWYADPTMREQLAIQDPKLYNFIKETEVECQSLLAISKNLIIVRSKQM